MGGKGWRAHYKPTFRPSRYSFVDGEEFAAFASGAEVRLTMQSRQQACQGLHRSLTQTGLAPCRCDVRAALIPDNWTVFG